MSILTKIGSIGTIFTGGGGMLWAAIGGAVLFTAYTGFVFHLGGNGPRAELETRTTQLNSALDANAGLAANTDAAIKSLQAVIDADKVDIAKSTAGKAAAQKVAATLDVVIADMKKQSLKPAAVEAREQKIRDILFGADKALRGTP